MRRHVRTIFDKRRIVLQIPIDPRMRIQELVKVREFLSGDIAVLREPHTCEQQKSKAAEQQISITHITHLNMTSITSQTGMTVRRFSALQVPIVRGGQLPRL